MQCNISNCLCRLVVKVNIGHTNQRRHFLPVDCVRQQAPRTGRLKDVTPACIAVQGLVSARP